MGIERIRERFNPDRSWHPRWLLPTVVVCGIGLAAVIPGAPFWMLLGSLAMVVGLLALYMHLPLADAWRRDRDPLTSVPREREELRPDVWEAFAGRVGLALHAGVRPLVTGAIHSVPVEVCIDRRRVGARKVRFTVVRTPTPRPLLGALDAEVVEGRVRATCAPREFEAAVLGPEAGALLLELADVTLKVGEDIEVLTRGFEADPARLESTLLLALTVARRLAAPGPSGESGETP